MVKIIECVPNFSEGVDTEVIIFLLKTFRNLQPSWVWPVKLLFYNQRHCVIANQFDVLVFTAGDRSHRWSSASHPGRNFAWCWPRPGASPKTCKNLPEWHQREQSHLVDQSDSVHVRWRPRQHCWSCSCSCQGDRKHLLKKYLVLVWQENSRLFAKGCLQKDRHAQA